ncbi:hypothetical protein KM1_025700 [Entamoeba histolytica HM-3:IMSS]|uniref:Uncharacterized protein n=2 Tax=Entamoeba histolytica TaxID=5759 RepID=A0A175JMP6_ENTHI|nr:hypothetical protein KM1_025700 [Entamoeba histolytica HM-3:IMSS]GAT94674.1 hypothetical protein CL6EHI_c00087 [Entamoeba histolytica]
MNFIESINKSDLQTNLQYLYQIRIQIQSKKAQLTLQRTNLRIKYEQEMYELFEKRKVLLN